MRTTKKATVAKAKTKKAPVKKYAKGGSKSKPSACPKGFTLINGKCTSPSGEVISAPYISPRGAFYLTEDQLITNCSANPNYPTCKKYIETLPKEERAKIYGYKETPTDTTSTKANKMKRGGMFKSKPVVKKTVKSVAKKAVTRKKK